MGNIALEDTIVKSPPPSRRDESAEEAAVLEGFEQRIFRGLSFPDHWEQDGVAQPNATAKEGGLEVCKRLFEEYRLVPSAILPSIEEGIYISYDKITADFNRSMIIEVYNTAEVALIICDNAKKKTMHSEDISGMNFRRAVSIFSA